MDEFALCWNNFSDNMATGFQNLFDRGEFVDVSIACEGKIIKAHKTILSICSPYFQELFLSNPCKHPIVILKDVSYSIMSELLQFMYQGEVNVRHKDLQTFMKVAESLQIKGLTTSGSTAKNLSTDDTSYNHNHHQSTANQRAAQQTNNNSHHNQNPLDLNFNMEGSAGYPGASNDSKINYSSGNKLNDIPSTSSHFSGHKRHMEHSSTNNNNNNHSDNHHHHSRKQPKYSLKSDLNDNDVSTDMDNASSDDVFIPTISPQISINESRFDALNVKREGSDQSSTHSQNSSTLIRNSFAGVSGGNFGNHGMPYNFGDFPNDMTSKNDFKQNSPHMDIPAVVPGERWSQGKLQFMLSQRGKPLLVHDGHSFGIQYIRKDKKYWQCNLSRKYNCKARVTTTDAGDIIVTNNEHCHTEIRQHLRKDYKLNKLNRLNRHLDLRNLYQFPISPNPVITTTTTSIIRGTSTLSTSSSKKSYPQVTRSGSMSPILSIPLQSSTPVNYSQSAHEQNNNNNTSNNIDNSNNDDNNNNNHQNQNQSQNQNQENTQN